jgi:hypothetical protein
MFLLMVRMVVFRWTWNRIYTLKCPETPGYSSPVRCSLLPPTILRAHKILGDRRVLYVTCQLSSATHVTYRIEGPECTRAGSYDW